MLMTTKAASLKKNPQLDISKLKLWGADGSDITDGEAKDLQRRRGALAEMFYGSNLQFSSEASYIIAELFCLYLSSPAIYRTDKQRRVQDSSQRSHEASTCFK